MPGVAERDRGADSPEREESQSSGSERSILSRHPAVLPPPTSCLPIPIPLAEHRPYLFLPSALNQLKLERWEDFNERGQEQIVGRH